MIHSNPARSGSVVDEELTEPLVAIPLLQILPCARELAAGSILRSRYVLEQLIGRGGDSMVFRATDLNRALPEHLTGGCIAIKVLLPERRGDPRALARLKREFLQMQCLTHPGIARVFDLDCDGDVWFMSMELVLGQTASSQTLELVGLTQRLDLIGACCEALEHAHSRGIVHGDIKPSNVLIASDGAVKLIDFGSTLSCGASVEAGSDPGLAATRSYASPQVLAGRRAEARDDIFSLAYLSYAILSRGAHPFVGEQGPVYVPIIPRRIFDVLARGLAPERERRPASVRAFLHELLGPDPSRCPASADQSLAVDSSPTSSRVALDVVGPTVHRFGARELWRRSTTYLLVLAGVVVVTVGAAVLMQQGVRHRATSVRGLPHFVPAQAPHAVAAVIPDPSVQVSRAPAAQPQVIPEPQPTRAASGIITFGSPTILAEAAQPLVAIPVERLHSTRGSGSVAWTIEGGTAQPNIDYRSVAPTVIRFVEGQTVRILFIPLISTDTAAATRASRSFVVALRKVTGGLTLGAITRVTVTIAPDSRER